MISALLPATAFLPVFPADGRPLPGRPPVVQNMTVTLPRGATCLLIGPNGAGKTTLLKVRALYGVGTTLRCVPAVWPCSLRSRHLSRSLYVIRASCGENMQAAGSAASPAFLVTGLAQRGGACAMPCLGAPSTAPAGRTACPQVLGGKHMVPESAVSVLGQPPFHATALTSSGALSYVGGNWERDIAFAGYAIPLAVSARCL